MGLDKSGEWVCLLLAGGMALMDMGGLFFVRKKINIYFRFPWGTVEKMSNKKN